MSDKPDTHAVCVAQLQQHIHTIETKLHGSLHALKNFFEAHPFDTKKKTQKKEDEGDGGKTTTDDNPIHYHFLQLVLQYRLNSHDILKSLFLCQQSLWQLLGICPANSSAINYERLAYALGSDDLHVLLSTLNQLVETLIRVIAQYQTTHKNKQSKAETLKKERLKTLEIAHYDDLPVKNLQNGLQLQKDVVMHLTETQAILETLQMGEPLLGGPMLDDIAALGEPISRLYQALEYGIELSGSLFQQMSMEYGVSASLTHIIEKLNRLGQSMHHPGFVLRPVQDTHQAFFSPEQHHTAQKLEEEASRLRLGNFFK